MSERCPVRVLLVLGSLEGGGAERVAVNLLRNCDPSRVDLRVGLLRREGDYLPQLQPEQMIGPVGRGRGLLDSFRAPFDVARMIGDASPDVVMSFGLGLNLAVCAALGFSARPRPYWICREDSNPWAEVLNLAAGPLSRAAVRAALRKAYGAADCLLTVSEDLAAALAGLALRIRAIHNPIDVEVVEAAARDPLAEAPSRPFVVAAGRLVRQKGFDLLLEAFAMSQAAKEMDLVILGDGPQRETLARRARELGVALALPGFQDNPWSWFARASLFALPSRWEGFGNVVAEAMACGAPVLVSDCDFGPREQVVHGESGWVTKPEPAEMSEAIDALLADPALCRRLAAAGRARARMFAAPLIAETYQRLFTGRPSLLAEPANPAVGRAAAAVT